MYTCQSQSPNFSHHYPPPPGLWLFFFPLIAHCLIHDPVFSCRLSRVLGRLWAERRMGQAAGLLKAQSSDVGSCLGHLCQARPYAPAPDVFRPTGEGGSPFQDKEKKHRGRAKPNQSRMQHPCHVRGEQIHSWSQCNRLSRTPAVPMPCLGWVKNRTRYIYVECTWQTLMSNGNHLISLVFWSLVPHASCQWSICIWMRLLLQLVCQGPVWMPGPGWQPWGDYYCRFRASSCLSGTPLPTRSCYMPGAWGHAEPVGRSVSLTISVPPGDHALCSLMTWERAG